MPTSSARPAQTSVLIVEDQPELLHRFWEAVLADDGLTLTAAVSNGASAIAVLGATAPDVVLLDLGRPDVHGIEVIRQVAPRQRSPAACRRRRSHALDAILSAGDARRSTGRRATRGAAAAGANGVHRCRCVRTYLSRRDDGGEQGGHRRQQRSAVAGFELRMTPVARSLPKLRFGDTDQMRLRAADVAGGGLQLDDPPAGTLPHRGVGLQRFRAGPAGGGRTAHVFRHPDRAPIDCTRPPPQD